MVHASRLLLARTSTMRCSLCLGKTRLRLKPLLNSMLLPVEYTNLMSCNHYFMKPHIVPPCIVPCTFCGNHLISIVYCGLTWSSKYPRNLVLGWPSRTLFSPHSCHNRPPRSGEKFGCSWSIVCYHAPMVLHPLDPSQTDYGWNHECRKNWMDRGAPEIPSLELSDSTVLKRL